MDCENETVHLSTFSIRPNSIPEVETAKCRRSSTHDAIDRQHEPVNPVNG